MRFKKIQIIILTLAFFICLGYAEDQEIDITSDMAEYSKTEKKAVFSGNVKLRTDTGGSGMYLLCKEAKMDTAVKDLILKDAYFTTCDLDNPHYRFFTKNVHIVLDEKMTAENIIFYVGKIPVFFLPYYYKSLRHRTYKLELKPGYSQREGVFAKGLFGYPVSENFYGKMYLDYYSYKGWGKGGELLYNVPDKMNGNLYGYHIEEKDTLKKRWDLRLYHWQSLPSNWISQINSNIMSDESFNYSYSDDWMRVNKNINSSVAFTKNTSRTTSRVVFSRYDVFNSTKNAFTSDTVIAPSVSYNVSQTKVGGLPLYYSWAANIDRLRGNSTGYYLVNGAGSFNLTSPLRLTRNIVLTSGLGFSEYWQDRKSQTDTDDVFRPVYKTDLNLKIRSWYVLEHNISHSFQQEINKKNDEYHGVLANKLLASEWLYLDTVSLHVWSGLDLMTKLNEKITSYRARMDDIVSEFDYTPYRQVDFYYRNNYSVKLGQTSSHQFSSSAKFLSQDKEAGYLKTGFSREMLNPDAITLLGEFGIRPTKKWQVAYKIQTSVNASRHRLSDLNVYEQAVNISRDLHCWEAYLSYSFRTPNYYEFWCNIKLKPASKKDTKIYPEDMERQWYPWR